MRRTVIFFSLLILCFFSASLALAQDTAQTRHTVQAGDNLFQIAQRYGVTVQAIAQANNLSDPNRLDIGQVLIIPSRGSTGAGQAQTGGTGGPAAPRATATPAPTTTAPAFHLVLDGENLYGIAARYQVTVAALAQANGISNFNLISVGQRLQIPRGNFPAAPPPLAGAGGANPGTGGAVAAPVNTPVTPVPQNQAAAVGFGPGLQILPQAEIAPLLTQAADLQVEWLQLEIDWALYEKTRGQIDFATLDALILPAHEAGFKLLLTVTNAPAWARANTTGRGPATNDADYAAFVRALAGHYRGQVQAYEIWSEPNVQREWIGKPLGAATYMNLLKLAYNAVKSTDPAALVVSAGLAPTSLNDGVNAVDDRAFLRGMYANGLAAFSDAVGARPYGWANPPDSSCCRTNRPAVTGWDESRAFFFLDTLNDYRQIMNSNNDSGAFLWVTGFGWGSTHGGPRAGSDFGYVNYTDPQEQGQYSIRALQIGRDLSYVGPMFLNNLNACTALGAEAAACYWSLTAADASPRPAYNALQSFLR